MKNCGCSESKVGPSNISIVFLITCSNVFLTVFSFTFITSNPYKISHLHVSANPSWLHVLYLYSLYRLYYDSVANIMIFEIQPQEMHVSQWYSCILTLSNNFVFCHSVFSKHTLLALLPLCCTCHCYCRQTICLCLMSKSKSACEFIHLFIVSSCLYWLAFRQCCRYQ